MAPFPKFSKVGFQTAADGRRLFAFGPLSRPYVVPNAEVEERITARAGWFWRRVCGGFLLLPLYTVSLTFNPTWRLFVHNVTTKPLWLVAFNAALFFALRASRQAALRKALDGLDRLDRRLPLAEFYENRALDAKSWQVLLAGTACVIFLTGTVVAFTLGKVPGATAVFFTTAFVEVLVISIFMLVSKRNERLGQQKKRDP